MPAGQPGRRLLGPQRVGDQGVREQHLPDAVGIGFEEPRRHRRFEPPQHDIDRFIDDAGQDAEVDPSPEHGRRDHQLLRRRRQQRRRAGAHDVVHGRRYGGQHGPLVDVPPIAGTADDATVGIGEQGHELPDEERVTRRAVVHQPADGAGAVAVEPGLDVAHAETAERDAHARGGGPTRPSELVGRQASAAAAARRRRVSGP